MKVCKCEGLGITVSMTYTRGLPHVDGFYFVKNVSKKEYEQYSYDYFVYVRRNGLYSPHSGDYIPYEKYQLGELSFYGPITYDGIMKLQENKRDE